MRFYHFIAALLGVAISDSFAKEVVLAPVKVTSSPLKERLTPRKTAPQMERRQERVLSQALRSETSLNIISQGGDHENTFAFFRGAPSQLTTVMRDGVVLNTQTELGRSSFADLTTQDLEEVELTPGPSSQTSSHAMGGTIALRTRQGKGAPSSLTQLERGSLRTTQFYETVQGATDRADFFLSGTLKKTGLGTRRNHLWGNRVADEDYLKRLTANVGVHLTPQLTLRVIGQLSHSDFAVNNNMGAFPQGSGDTSTIFQGRSLVRLTHTRDAGRSRTLTLHQARLDNRFLTTSVFFSRSDMVGVTYKEAFALAKAWDAWVAYDGLQDQLTQGKDAILKKRERVHTPTLGARYGGDRLRVSAEGKAYWAEKGKPEWSYALEAQTPLTPRTLGFVRQGRGIKRPLLLDRFGSAALFQVANPALKAQTSTSVEVGVKHAVDAAGRIEAQASVFYTLLRDLLQVAQVAPMTYQSRNQGKRYISGLELAARAKPTDACQVNLSYTYTKPRTGAGQDTPTLIAHHQVGLEGVYQPSPAWSFFSSALWRSHQKDYNFALYPKAPVTLRAYALVRAGVTYEGFEKMKIFGRIENALNKKYETSYGYGARGTTVMVGASYCL